jgi:NitT/TauT family transport system ATP-binding protein
LRVANLRKTYEGAHQPYVALDGVDVEIVAGEFFCLLGPSGCGKSTLLNILAGFEPAAGGLVTSDGVAITGAGRDRVMFFQALRSTAHSASSSTACSPVACPTSA